MEAKLKREKTKRVFGTPTQKKTGPGRMAQTPRAGTGDSVGLIRCHWCSTLFKDDSKFFHVSYFLDKIAASYE